MNNMKIFLEVIGVASVAIFVLFVVYTRIGGMIARKEK